MARRSQREAIAEPMGDLGGGEDANDDEGDGSLSGRGMVFDLMSPAAKRKALAAEKKAAKQPKPTGKPPATAPAEDTHDAQFGRHAHCGPPRRSCAAV